MSDYFVIKCDCDTQSITRMSKQELLDMMNEDSAESTSPTQYDDPFAKGYTLYLDGPEVAVIIKGEVVVPRPKTVVTKFEVD